MGKSTLFNALTKNNVLAANYPFATIEPNVGVVGVPDARLGKLAEIFGSEKLLPATVSFVDIAGIVKGASEGAGLGFDPKNNTNGAPSWGHAIYQNTLIDPLGTSRSVTVNDIKVVEIIQTLRQLPTAVVEVLLSEV